MAIYFTSDLHLGHLKSFLFEPRGFSNIEDHDKQIVENWNSIISEDDEVYCLGDCMLNDNENGIRLMSQLNGKIHLIRGNHDTDARIQLYSALPNVIEICEGKFFKYKKYHFYLSHFPCIVSNYDEDKPLQKRMINVCGHSHCKNRFKDMDKGLIYHAELDAHNCIPVSIDNIIEDIEFFISMDKNDQLRILKNEIY